MPELSNTGEVITAIENENKAYPHEAPDWNKTVELLNESYPIDYKPSIYSQKLNMYQAESKKNAQREKE